MTKQYIRDYISFLEFYININYTNSNLTTGPINTVHPLRLIILFISNK